MPGWCAPQCVCVKVTSRDIFGTGDGEMDKKGFKGHVSGTYQLAMLGLL